MDIENISWQCDSTGTNYFHSHLSMTARDLAKMGYLLANGGCYKGKSLIKPWCIGRMMTPSQKFDPFFGLLWGLNFYSTSCWWEDVLLKQYQCEVDPEFVNPLKSLCGRVIFQMGYLTKKEGCGHFDQQVIDILGGLEKTRRFYREVADAHLPNANWKVENLASYEGLSDSGQQLIVFPETKVVGVRLIQQRNGYETVDKFADFGALVEKLTYWMERS